MATYTVRPLSSGKGQVHLYNSESAEIGQAVGMIYKVIVPDSVEPRWHAVPEYCKAEAFDTCQQAAEFLVTRWIEGTITVNGQSYTLPAMTSQELEELYSDLFNAAAEASSRRLRHGWQGGEVMYRQYQGENWNARQSIEQELERRTQKEVA